MKYIIICFMVLLASCQSYASSSYIGIYTIHVKNGDDPRKAVKYMAEKIINESGLKIDDIVDDGISLNLIVRQVHGDKNDPRPGLVFSYVTIPGNFWTITISTDGSEEDYLVKDIRIKIEQILNETSSSKWSYVVTHRSMAKP